MEDRVVLYQVVIITGDKIVPGNVKVRTLESLVTVGQHKEIIIIISLNLNLKVEKHQTLYRETNVGDSVNTRSSRPPPLPPLPRPLQATSCNPAGGGNNHGSQLGPDGQSFRLYCLTLSLTIRF